MIWLRSLAFTAFLFLSVPFHASGALFAGLFGHRYAYVFAANWATVNLWLLRHLCHLDWQVEGTENIPAQNCVLYWKHQSVYEALVSARLFPPQTWVVKRELMWIPFFGWGLAMLKPIAINRKAGRTAVKQVLNQGRERLAEGLWIVIFPEGTRVAPGQTRRYGISGAALAKLAGRPVLPIAHNAGDFWPRRSWVKRPGTVQVVIGPLIDTADRGPEEVNRLAQAWVETTMARISPAYSLPAELRGTDAKR